MKKKSLESLDSEVFVTSTLYYPKEELSKFVELFSMLDIIDDRLSRYVDIIRESLKAGKFDNLPLDPEARKKNIINLVTNKIATISNTVAREKFEKWFDEACGKEQDLELQEELLYRYCWSEFVDRVNSEDIKNTDFRDKLNIKPIIPDMTDDTICALEDIDITEEKESGEIFPTGITPLDDMVKMRRTNFVVIAARTTVGKSLFMINQAINIAASGKPVLYTSLEESKSELKKRVISHIGLDKGKEQKVMKNFFIYNPKNGSPDTIFGDIEKIIQEKKMSAIFIDYIQLMKYPGMTDWDSLRILTRELKLFAIRNNILLVTASQTRRDAEIVGNSLTTLFGSSTIEADANIIMFLEPKRKQNVRVNNRSAVTIAVAKNRSGEQGNIDAEISYSNGHIEAI